MAQQIQHGIRSIGDGKFPIGGANLGKLIQSLDRKIDAVRREMLSREKIDRHSWRSWGDAWARQPELHRRERNLFWLRGEFQIHEARIEHERAMRVARTTRLPKVKACKTCGGTGIAGAA